MSKDFRQQRMVVCRHTHSGFGNHMSCLMGSWLYAKKTNRELYVDWRGSRYGDGISNVFSECFEYKPRLAGVPIHLAKNDEPAIFDESTFPAAWSNQHLSSKTNVEHSHEQISYLNQLAVHGTHRKEATVVFRNYMYLENNPEVRRDLKPLLEQLNFRSEIREQIDEFILRETSEKYFVGVHLRHGNGENLEDRVIYWKPFLSSCIQILQNYGKIKGGSRKQFVPTSTQFQFFQEGPKRRIYKLVKRQIERIRSHNSDPVGIFLFTDSPRIERDMKSLLPQIYTLDKIFRNDDTGPLHRKLAKDKHRNSISFELFLEMELMKRCTEFIYIPSQLSFAPRCLLEQENLHELKPPLLNQTFLLMFKNYFL
jgi:hypothetical protein